MPTSQLNLGPDVISIPSDSTHFSPVGAPITISLCYCPISVWDKTTTSNKVHSSGCESQITNKQNPRGQENKYLYQPPRLATIEFAVPSDT